MPARRVVTNIRQRGPPTWNGLTWSLLQASSTTRSTARFTWEGNDEMEHVFGRGWTSVRPDGSMRGHIYFHQGDDSEFVARKADPPPPKSKTPKR